MAKHLLTSLKARLTLLLAVGASVALILISVFGFIQLRRNFAQTQTGAMRLVHLLAREHQYIIQETQTLLTLLSELPEVLDRDVEASSALFARLVAQYPRYRNIAAIAPSGIVFASAISLSDNGPFDASDRLYFIRAVESKRFTIGEYQVSRVNEDAIIVFASPVYDKAGALQAVVVAVMELEWFNEYLAALGLPPGSVLNLIDKNGVMLARFPEGGSWVGRDLSASPVIRRLLAGGDVGSYREKGIDGVRRLYGAVRIQPDGSGMLYISAGIPTTAIAGETTTQLIAFLLVGILITVLVIAVAWIGSRRLLLLPLSELVHAVGQVAAGNYTVRTAQPGYPEEIASITSAFDALAETLGKRETQLEEGRKRLQKLNEELEEQNSILETILRTTPDHTYLLDPQMHILYAGHCGAQALGQEARRLIGKPWAQLGMPEELTEPLQSQCRQVFANGDRSSGEIACHPEAGKQVYEYSIDPVVEQMQTGDGVSSLLLTLREITHRKRMEEELVRVDRALRVLSGAGQVIVRATDEQTLFQQICRLSVAVGGYRLAWIGRAVGDEHNTVEILACYGPAEAYLQGLEVSWADGPLGQSPVGRALRTKRTMVSRDIAADPSFAPWRHRALEHGLCCSCALPLVIEEEMFGSLNIYAAEAEAFQAEELKLLESVADLLSHGVRLLRTRIQNRRTAKAVQRSKERYRLLLSELDVKVEQERTHLARELHDRLGQELTLIRLELLELKEQVDSAKAREGLAAAFRAVDEAITQTRSLTAALRPLSLDELSLSAAITSHVKQFAQRTDIACRLSGLPE